ncbi:hypothetical protein IW262DRAFT_1302251 [Armillaria fumosa]|nr:hypothetical protein IW262DRAFT_1302251 [Armillaria fumosa]
MTWMTGRYQSPKFWMTPTGFVRMMWESTLETLLDRRGVMMLVWGGEVLHIPADAPDDALTLDPGEYCSWLCDTHRKGQCSKDKEALKECNVCWHQMCQHPCHKPEDCGDFQHRKRVDEAQHYHAGHDEPTNDIYDNIPSAGPSGWVTMLPSWPNPPPQLHDQLQRYQLAFPMRPPLFIASSTGYQMNWFAPPC